MSDWRDSEPTTVLELIKLHGEGIKIISEAPEIKGTEIWSNVHLVEAGGNEFVQGDLWRQNARKNDGRNVGKRGMSDDFADKPIWHRYDVGELVKEETSKTAPAEADWYEATIETANHRLVTLRAWFNPASPGFRKWWLGEPGHTVALQDIIPGAMVTSWKEVPKPQRTLTWSNEDPREKISRGNIVVAAPEGEVFAASVETKHAYCVFLKRTDDVRNHIAEGDDWPPEWQWVRAP